MKTTYIIDTSAIMDFPEVIEALGGEWNAHIYIPEAVIHELDYHKDKGTPDKSRKALAALKEINKLQKGFGKGPFKINKEKGSFFFIGSRNINPVGPMIDKGDREVLGLAVALKNGDDSDDVIVITGDATLKSAAKSEGLWGASYPLTPYDVLSISEVCDETEIKSAYRRNLHKWHPDKLQSLGLSEFEMNYAKAKLLAAQGAFERLKGNTGYKVDCEKGTANNSAEMYEEEDFSGQTEEDYLKDFKKDFKGYHKSFKKRETKKWWKKAVTALLVFSVYSVLFALVKDALQMYFLVISIPILATVYSAREDLWKAYITGFKYS